MTQLPLVLLVDDEPLLRETLVEILSGEGFQAVSAGDSAAAMRLFEEMNPHLVICDVVMPGTSGIDTAKQLRQRSAAVPIILFSGQAAATDLIASAQSEGYNFEVLAKPIKPETLISVIRQQLNEAGSSSLRHAHE